MGFYKGKSGSEIVDEAEGKTDGFKKGGRAAKKKGGKVMGEAAEASACRKPRKSGGAVFSSAANGSPRKPSSHY